MTIQHEEILKKMQHGMYLVKVKKAEGLTYSLHSFDNMGQLVKAGSIAALEKMGFIRLSINHNKWLLTDEGRKAVVGIVKGEYSNVRLYDQLNEMK